MDTRGWVVSVVREDAGQMDVSHPMPEDVWAVRLARSMKDPAGLEVAVGVDARGCVVTEFWQRGVESPVFLRVPVGALEAIVEAAIAQRVVPPVSDAMSERERVLFDVIKDLIAAGSP